MNFVKSGVMKFVVIFRIYIILSYIFVRYRYKSVMKNYRIFHLVVESFTKIWIIKAVPYLKVWNDSSPPPTHTHTHTHFKKTVIFFCFTLNLLTAFFDACENLWTTFYWTTIFIGVNEITFMIVQCKIRYILKVNIPIYS